MSAHTDPATSSSAPALARTMGLGALIIYGVGDMLGAGVYALIGKAAGTMGNAVWLAFLASVIAALLTGLSYASLGSRHPRAGGVAYISQRAFGLPFLSYLLGLAVVASGLTSLAAGARAFAGYFLGVLNVDATGTWAPVVVIIGYIGVLTLINFWGMRESTWLNVLCTVIEAGGLLIIIAVGLRYWGGVNYLETPVAVSGTGGITFPLVLSGAVLTFYSFVGFEDMLNVTEEVKDPQRNFPIAVMAALGITTLIYIAIAITAVSVVPHAELARSGQPLVEVVKRAAPDFPSGIFSFISLFAITNTGLLNYIMGSRLLYGLARQGLVPRALGNVHPTRRTPHVAILTLLLIVLLLALSGNVGQLASATSVLLLGVFIVVNASLLALQRRQDEPRGRFEVHPIIPAAGILVCGVILFHAQPAALLTALALLAGIAVLYFLMRSGKVVSSDEPRAS
ncbi:MAG TPA: amino acid permease [Chthoniobacteraceae bacterium]